MRISGRGRSPLMRGSFSTLSVRISPTIWRAVASTLRRIVAGDEDRDVAPVAGTRLALEIDARVRDCAQLRQNAILPLLLGDRALAPRHQGDVQIREAHLAGLVRADALDDVRHLRLLLQDVVGGGGLRRGFLELHAGRQLDDELGAREIGVRNERFRDQRRARPIERTKKTMPPPIVSQRCWMHRRSVFRYHFMIGPSGCGGDAVGSQRIRRDDRRDEPRDEQREEHRRGHRQAELDEVLPGDAAHEADGQEDGDDRHGAGDHRETDLVGRIERRLEAALAHAHVAHDVLDLDDRIVDQDAGDQRQREQAHLVQRESHPLHERRRSESPTAEWRAPRWRSRASHAGRTRRPRTARIAPSMSATIAEWYICLV